MALTRPQGLASRLQAVERQFDRVDISGGAKTGTNQVLRSSTCMAPLGPTDGRVCFDLSLVARLCLFRCLSVPCAWVFS